MQAKRKLSKVEKRTQNAQEYVLGLRNKKRLAVAVTCEKKIKRGGGIITTDGKKRGKKEKESRKFVLLYGCLQMCMCLCIDHL